MSSEIDRFIDSIFLPEAFMPGTNYVSAPFHSGGLPDLSGSPRAFEGMVANRAKVLKSGDKKAFYIKTHPYDTPQSNLKKSYHYYATLLNDDKGLERTVVFSKAPSTFAEDRRQDKLQKYLADEYGYTGAIANEKRVSPGLINMIGARECTFGEYREIMAKRAKGIR